MGRDARRSPHYRINSTSSTSFADGHCYSVLRNEKDFSSPEIAKNSSKNRSKNSKFFFFSNPNVNDIDNYRIFAKLKERQNKIYIIKRIHLLSKISNWNFKYDKTLHSLISLYRVSFCTRMLRAILMKHHMFKIYP